MVLENPFCETKARTPQFVPPPRVFRKFSKYPSILYVSSDLVAPTTILFFASIMIRCIPSATTVISGMPRKELPVDS
ncbi:putative transmembrane protein [Stenotrophomonas maltophilia K279a]|uniref:Transmembrane protein n=1 Tax=Stenotrophomonas maltophilia (strain K279a) TaxID=522373 RepID=B2FM04_STRMK|nr:putative transmembrane protein [Stenotrophomonas maltophilia K279a]